MSEPDTHSAQTTLFFSYSRADQKRALPIIRALENAGYEVWWDGLLEPGETYLPTTEAALENADAVVVLWSKTSVDSHWVRDEATRGRDRRCLVPLSLDGSDAPLGFRQFQTTDFSRWKGNVAAPEFVRICRSIDGYAVQASLRGTVPVPATKIDRRLMLGSGAALLIAGGTWTSWRMGLLGGSTARNSLAVLPFRNLSGDPGQDYFSDGLSEELRTTLSLNKTLSVVAETSSNKFRDAKQGIQEIARALGVAAILEGSVRRDDSIMRVNAKLVDGKTGFDSWSQTFDRKLDDVLGVQSDIATIVADALIANLAKGDSTPAARIGGTRNNKAFDAYLRGKALYKLAANEESDRGALARFDEAIVLDPNFASAHVARSVALTVIAGTYAQGEAVQSAIRQAADAANTAIRLAPDLAEGHAALGFVLFNGRLDVRASRAPYQRSFELGFGNSGILTAYAEYAANIGAFEDGRKAIARAQRLDPLNSAVFRTSGILEFYAGNKAAAQSALRAALSLNPKSGIVHRFLGDMALTSGNASEARDHYAKEPFDILQLPGLAIADMAMGKSAAAQAHLAELIKRYGDNSYYQQAEVLAQWGKAEPALVAFEKAWQRSDAGLVQSKHDPLLDPIRHDPRFVSILQKLGLS